MNVNGRERLWHDGMMMRASVFSNPKGSAATGARKRGANRMPQRGIGLQPKVGAPAPTVGHRETNHQPQRGYGKCRARWSDGNGRNRVAVGDVGGKFTQGSACRETLGFGTESRWDSQIGAMSRSNSRTFRA